MRADAEYEASRPSRVARPRPVGHAGSMANRLRDATSPYLRQHANNPVDWWPWGDEAFAEGAARGVPVFLSIGYSTCHWCHEVAA